MGLSQLHRFRCCRWLDSDYWYICPSNLCRTYSASHARTWARFPPQVPLRSSRTSHPFLSQVLADTLIPPLLPILLISGVFCTALPNWHLAVKFQVSPSRSKCVTSLYDYSHQGTRVRNFRTWTGERSSHPVNFFWDLMINRSASGIGARESPLLEPGIRHHAILCRELFHWKGRKRKGYLLCVWICVTPQPNRNLWLLYLPYLVPSPYSMPVILNYQRQRDRLNTATIYSTSRNYSIK